MNPIILVNMTFNFFFPEETERLEVEMSAVTKFLDGEV